MAEMKEEKVNYYFNKVENFIKCRPKKQKAYLVGYKELL